MSAFRKKPVVIDAIQLGYSPQSLKDALDFIGSTKPYVVQDDKTESHAIIIPTFEGDMRANVEDWIIRGVQGEIYPCKPDIFAATYEPAPAQPVAATVAAIAQAMQDALETGTGMLRIEHIAPEEFRAAAPQGGAAPSLKRERAKSVKFDLKITEADYAHATTSGGIAAPVLTDPLKLTDAQLLSACLSYRHDFWLLEHAERMRLMFKAREWLHAFGKELESPQAPTAVPMEAAPQTYEHRRAIMEGERNDAANQWDKGMNFASEYERRLFERGFDSGWTRATNRAASPTPAAAPIPADMVKDAVRLDYLQSKFIGANFDYGGGEWVNGFSVLLFEHPSEKEVSVDLRATIDAAIAAQDAEPGVRP